MKKISLLLLAVSALMTVYAQSKKDDRVFFQLKIYNYSTTQQGEGIHRFLKDSYLPALHRQGYKYIGVFSDLSNDTGSVKKIYVLEEYASIEKLLASDQKLLEDKAYQAAGADHLNASPDQQPFSRIETILMKAFRYAPRLMLPDLKNPRENRVYELRSYESPTQMKLVSKVHMFNEGGEVPLFKRLEFNSVFYGEVIAGSKMPNLMYMTTFEDMASRESHWVQFFDAPEWKILVVKPEYQKNVSHADIIFLRPTPYSDY